MADFETTGIGELIQKLERADLFTPENQQRILDAGSETLKTAIKEEANRAPYKLTGLMGKLTKRQKVKYDKQGNPYQYITISGKNKRGQRNATVGFVLNYGRNKKYGRIKGSYFWTRARKRCEQTVPAAQQEIINEILDQEGLI